MSLNLIGGLDRPDAGKVVVARTDVGRLNDDERSDFRVETIGFFRIANAEVA